MKMMKMKKMKMKLVIVDGDDEKTVGGREAMSL